MKFLLNGGSRVNVKDSEIKAVLSHYKSFSVYGLSPDPTKPSHYVPLYMQDHGWKIVGTYPQPHCGGGFQVYKSFAEVPAEYRKFVDVFRSSDRIPEVVDEVLSVGGVEVLWLQLGISHPEAETRAEKAGLKVISNRCLIIEHKKYFS
jgi:predicted CoA-binding protein